ncbi:MAG: 3-oxoacyl-[acyl-carrier-protein] reductase FabG [Candidatus Heimdallarchaeota archaeon LC_2]|nr:MAG: 3-oxoacyl-[acyl-carrier-protein] reductase FabG [Candidatus Heimdallarchaeota archaeon LC_2]
MSSKIKGPILVTGSSSGIGRKIVELLASRGHLVYACARKEQDILELEQIDNVKSIKLDVTNNDQIKNMVEFIENQGKGLYGLVNNAGVTDIAALVEMNEDDFHFVLNVNLYGVFRVTKALHEYIIETKGRIVNIGSIAGILAEPYMGVYNASKHALEGYTDNLAHEMGKYSVDVSIVEPGNYKSQISQNSGIRVLPKLKDRKASKYINEIKKIISSPDARPDRGQFKEPDEVADAIYHALTSDKPKPRYMVVPNELEARATIERAMQELVELNEWHAYSYNRDELISMLDAKLENN